jgi:hypothetical protein
MTLLDSNPIYDRLTLLAACLCAELENPDNGVPGACFCGIVPGESVPVARTRGRAGRRLVQHEHRHLTWLSASGSPPLRSS